LTAPQTSGKHDGPQSAVAAILATDWLLVHAGQGQRSKRGLSERRQAAKRALSIDLQAGAASGAKYLPSALPVGLRSDSEVGADGVNRTKAAQSIA
jgi:hypothetical protein